MTITEKVATLYHTARGLIKMKFSFKRAKFKQDDYLVQTHMRMVITEVEKLEQVPNFGNISEMVKLAVEEFKRKEAELKAIEEAPIPSTPKVEEAPKEVVTPTVSEAPKETTVEEHTERKEEHAE